MIISPPKKRANNSEGWHEASISSIDYLQDVIYFEKMTDVLDITFELSNGNYITQRYNYSFHSKSNLYSLIVALTDEKPDYDAGLNTEELLNQECLIKIEHNEDSKGNVWENVREVKKVDEKMLEGNC